MPAEDEEEDEEEYGGSSSSGKRRSLGDGSRSPGKRRKVNKDVSASSCSILPTLQASPSVHVEYLENCVINIMHDWTSIT